MRDVLAGGILVRSGSPAQPSLVKKVLPRRPGTLGLRRVALRRPHVPMHKVVVQPGQLASPHMAFGYPSLAMH